MTGQGATRFAAGGWWEGGSLVTWGDGLRRWQWPTLNPVLLRPGRFSAACAFGDGYALEQGDRLVWWRPGASDSVIEPAAAAMDLLEAALFGRKGLLVTHRGMQLRFYEPGDRGGGWPYREIYSFYTNSEQGGLLATDIDGDGRPDLFCGNYWVQSPRSFEEPWRLYAINLFHEQPQSASARLLWHGGRLLWLESKSREARASWFTPPPDPRQLWTEEPLGFPLRYPKGVVAAGEEVWIGESTPDSPRLWEWPARRSLPLPAAVEALLYRDGALVAIDSGGVPHRIGHRGWTGA